MISRCVSGSEQYRLTVERTPGGFGGDTAAAKDDDPISHADYFLRFVANEDNCDPLSRQVGDDPMDFRLCSDVNASRRLIEYEDSWRWNQPFRQQHLLLVSSGEGIGQLLDSSCDDSHPSSEVPGDLPLLRAVDDPKSIGELSKDRERFVRANRKLKHEALLVAVFGQERDSEAHRLPRRTRSDQAAVHSDLALVGPRDTEEHLGDLRAAGADEAEEAQNLARPDVEANVLYETGSRESPHSDDRHPNLRIFFREEGPGFSTDHVTNDLFRSEFGGRRCNDTLA